MAGVHVRACNRDLGKVRNPLVLDSHREDKRRRNHERQPGPPSPLRRKEAAWEAEQAVACVESAVEDAVGEGTFACIVCHCMAILQLGAKDKYGPSQRTSTKCLRTNLRSLDDLVVFKGVEVILDVNWSPLDNPCPKEGIGHWRLGAACYERQTRILTPKHTDSTALGLGDAEADVALIGDGAVY